MQRVQPGTALRLSADCCRSAPPCISVLTYNLLASIYVRVPGQPWNAFQHVSEEDLDPQNRLPKICKELLCSEADVLCLQEVEFERRLDSDGTETWQLPAWTAVLKDAGYAGMMQGLSQKEWAKNAERNANRERGVGKAIPTGVATFYRADMWEEFAPSKHGSGSGTVIYLRAKSDPAMQVAIGNVHLNGSPTKMDIQTKQLDGCLKNLSAAGEGVAKMIAGDFNNECLPGSQVAEWMARAGLSDLQIGGSTWAEPGTGLHLDHIAFTGACLRPLLVTEPLTEEDIKLGLPHAARPSDHAAVGGVFEFCL